MRSAGLFRPGGTFSTADSGPSFCPNDRYHGSLQTGLPGVGGGPPPGWKSVTVPQRTRALEPVVMMGTQYSPAPDGVRPAGGS